MSAPPAPVARRGHRRPAAWGTLVASLAVLTGAAVLSLKVGGRPLSWAQLHDGLLGLSGTSSDIVVRHVRLPRTLAGLLAGCCLGLAGAIAQGLTRNPLAGPGTLGVNAGAAGAIIAGISLFGVGSLSGYVWFGLVGGALAAVAVYAVGGAGRDGATPVKLAMAGAAVSALILSATSAVVLLDRELFVRYRFWVIGSLARADLATVAQAVPFAVAGVVLAVVLVRRLDAVALGEDTGRSLGARPGATRVTGLVAVVALAGTATAVAGPVAFVGLVAPHAVRALAATAHRWVLPLSALLAAGLVLLADVAGRVVIAPEEVQIGVMAAIVGGPVFLHLVRVRRVAAL
ncbi:iron ABC transporter permease [Pseudonocardia sp. KRD291]|uniref:FecCD family ABC transporter permease n=1 Tax=Pseudonocardia sp. KRD291 TaxID=2792007 RepID=UPI001C4A069A|nr:iron chelate uptake ABC transporter family permease subunit [Pseudonocardia sp. KRD291]MBW0105196.1 iron chelate uptake ABC transporter family permease subunit [Pseudonocardia sp. KRD291]